MDWSFVLKIQYMIPHSVFCDQCHIETEPPSSAMLGYMGSESLKSVFCGFFNLWILFFRSRKTTCTLCLSILTLSISIRQWAGTLIWGKTFKIWFPSSEVIKVYVSELFCPWHWLSRLPHCSTDINCNYVIDLQDKYVTVKVSCAQHWSHHIFSVTCYLLCIISWR